MEQNISKIEYLEFLYCCLMKFKFRGLVASKTGNRQKYSPEKSTPGVLFSLDLSTPQYFFPRK